MSLDPVLHRFVDASSIGVMHLQPYGNQYVQPTPRPLPPKVETMKFWDKIFPSAMKCLRACEEPYDHRKSEFEIRTSQTWAEICRRLGNAREIYEHRVAANKAEKLINKARIGLRTGMDKGAGPLKQAAQFVPDIDIASPIIGAVKVLFGFNQAYQNAMKVREVINDGFDDLSTGIAFIDIDFYVTQFPNDPNIIKASEDLVLAIFKAVEHAIGFYIGHQIKRAMSAVFGGDSYQERLKNSLSDIKSCSRLLKCEGEKSEFHYNSESRRQDRQESATMSYQLNATNQFLCLLFESERRRYQSLAEQIYTISRAPSPQPVIQAIYTPKHIWKMLHIPKLDDVDISHNMSRAASFLPEDNGRAEQLVGTTQFQTWILDHRMNKLLVHGDFGINKPESPFSVLCAKLMQALRSQSGFISLVFFCGCHRAPRDHHSGPLNMIRSLVAQVLEQFTQIPDTLANDVNLASVDAGEIQHLCTSFVCLVRQLPATTTIVCMIDGIQFYEQDQYENDVEVVLGCLLSLADNEDPSISVRFKILLTSPRPTTRVRRRFQIGISLLNMASVTSNEQGPSQARLEHPARGHESQPETLSSSADVKGTVAKPATDLGNLPVTTTALEYY
ncbi:hypothetical protein BELL_0504g00070 [Botrytis elliptica]|uniref:Nephrocystin 3-like N-terminal domain-containing protein n=1 Tax=Botrytis elliptica TaxID=278938 RepID=A0A4Z1JE80_9HELO|nr:hypothetical protein BELL_0504g00070 [Botrytis elliptica]